MDQSDSKIAIDFFSTFQIEVVDQSAFLLSSTQQQILVRTHFIHPEDHDTIEQVTNLMDLHISFDKQYVAPLIHFEKCAEGVRSFYRVDRLTLKQEVHKRSERRDHFSQQELWVLLSSLVDSLLYLQNNGTIYGVLSPSKIFVQNQIRLMDPSAFNLAPVSLSRLSLHSPQIAATEPEIDFYQSDVYLLGLCLLEAASLTTISNKTTSEQLQEVIEDISQRYSSELMHVLSYLLKEQPQKRPSFSDVKEYIEAEIQIRSCKQWAAETLSPDTEDSPSSNMPQCLPEPAELIDRLEIVDAKGQNRKQSEYERARGKFLQSPGLKDTKRLPNTTHSTCETLKQHSKQSKNHKKTQESKYVEAFQLKIPETVNKKPRLSRALQIKNRNAQHVKKIDSHRFDNYEQPFTNPALMSILKQETQRAKEYLKASCFR